MCARVNNTVCSINALAEKLILTADSNEINCEDDTCLLAYSLFRDCGYHIKKIMAEEDSRHCDH